MWYELKSSSRETPETPTDPIFSLDAWGNDAIKILLFDVFITIVLGMKIARINKIRT